MLKIQQLAKAASVAALTLGVAFGAQSAQKADAQVITGAGASSVTTLLNSSSSPVLDYATGFGYPYRYVITGSGAGRTAFLNGDTDFVATDGIGTSFGAGTRVQDNTIVDASGNPVIDPFTGTQYVVVNEARLNVVFPYNVPGFNGQLSRQEACNIINGQDPDGNPITNWSQVGGPDLPIIRVGRGDNSGTTATLQGGFIAGVCNNPDNPILVNGQPFGPNGGFASNPIPNITVGGANGGVNIPNPNGNEFIVQPPANPFTSNNDENPDSYSLGVVNTVRNTPGAIGYTEGALAAGLTLAQDGDNNNTTTVAIGPTYVIFRGDYFDETKNAAAQTVCYGSIFSGFLNQAGFNVNPEFQSFDGPEVGDDTDNYGDLDTNFGPCQNIGNFF